MQEAQQPKKPRIWPRLLEIFRQQSSWQLKFVIFHVQSQLLGLENIFCVIYILKLLSQEPHLSTETKMLFCPCYGWVLLKERDIQLTYRKWTISKSLTDTTKKERNKTHLNFEIDPKPVNLVLNCVLFMQVKNNFFQ